MSTDANLVSTPESEMCRNVIGPVWKLGGESWICELPVGHEGDHATKTGTWWVGREESSVT